MFRKAIKTQPSKTAAKPQKPSTKERKTVQKVNKKPEDSKQRSTGTGPGPAKDSYRYTQFQMECLERHNELRAMHGCPPLELSEDLCKFAKEWAKNMASCSKMSQRPNHNYGENLYMALGQEVDGKMPVQEWYDEMKDYNFTKGAFSRKSHHFTQVLWKSTQKLGVAFEKKGISTWVVANYSPSGNVTGEYTENIPRVCKQDASPCNKNQRGSEPTTAPNLNKSDLQPKLHKFSEFEEAGLAAHNRLRALHGSPPLKLNRELCDFAQEWAKMLQTSLSIARNSKFGENVYMSEGKGVTPDQVVDSWYGAGKDYKYSSKDGVPGKDTGHFTQLVWKDTKELGFAVNTQGNKSYVVAIYDPHGNDMANIAANVSPPIRKSLLASEDGPAIKVI